MNSLKNKILIMFWNLWFVSKYILNPKTSISWELIQKQSERKFYFFWHNVSSFLYLYVCLIIIMFKFFCAKLFGFHRSVKRRLQRIQIHWNTPTTWGIIFTFITRNHYLNIQHNAWECSQQMPKLQENLKIRISFSDFWDHC